MLRKIECGIKSLLRGKRGQGITEYAAILAIVVALALLVSGNDGFKTKISALYTSLAEQVQGLAGTTGGTTTPPAGGGGAAGS